ncbi:M23 family metallopeptidase [Paenibacillus athensensis]|uniref:Peptidase M23 n=2 Tax=Paenibacillus athensensis TaxID=1967502 RepID=A0A4Y8Q6M2_9BACL|nr:M23 family metallopeptidase [Paenibacillus athensensis]
MIIPGANRRTVRLQLPQSSLYVVPGTLLLVVIGFFVTIFVMNSHFHHTTDSMQSSFDGQERLLADQITLKDNELEQLQGDLIDMSQQAAEFRAKLEDIKKLQKVVELMTHTQGTSKSSADPAIPPAAGVAKDVGGAETAVTPEEVARMVSETRHGLSALVADVNDTLASLTDAEARLQEAERLQRITPTLYPADSRTVTSGFGIRRDPFTQRPAMHAGIDFDGELNDPVYATAEGTVVEAGFDSLHGNHIILDHTRGLQTEYMHMTKLLVKAGQAVAKGQQIGLIGSTGRSTGTHLHYEVHRYGVQIDPAPFLISDRKDER